MAATRPGVRLAELVASLSLGIDLGFGQPMEHVLRQSLIALRIAAAVDPGQSLAATTYYTSLLVNVGCHTDAHEQAKWFGDDIAMKAKKYDHDMRSARAAVSAMRDLGAGHPPLHRFRVGLEFVMGGHRELDGMIDHHAKMTRLLAEQLGLPDLVLDAVGSAYERWDGRGWPGTSRGDAIPLPARIVQLAEFVEVAQRVGGIDAAVALARSRAGKQFDPRLSACFADHVSSSLAAIDELSTWDAVIAAEPTLAVVLDDDELDLKLFAIANFVDLKSPFFLGHSVAVADLAAAAAQASGMPEPDVRLLRRAAMVTAYGRLGISNAIWDKPGALGPGEWERVRLQPYFTERMLRQSPALASIAALAVQQRERLDGSGYPKGVRGGALSLHARLLGAADAYQAMREPRPHRPAMTADAAERELRSDVRVGRLDGAAAEAVLACAGHRVRRRVEGPAGLTAREVEVLRLVARGLSTKAIAEKLIVSPKTAGKHLEHVYTKIGADNRASASLFAVRYGLVPEEQLGIHLKIRRTPDAAGRRLVHHHGMDTKPAALLKTFDDPDETNELPSGRARADALTVSGGRLVRATTEPGFRWSTDVQPLMGGDACTMAHFGLVLEGRYHFEFEDGTSVEVDPGGVFQIPAGRPHDEWVVGDAQCRTIDFYLQSS